MQVSGHASLTAPQPSGKAPTTAGAGTEQERQTTVQPAIGAREAPPLEGPPAQFWRRLNGPDPASHIAPPSIMQIKISQMLDAQADGAEEPSEEADPLPEAEPPGQGPASTAPENPPPGDAARQGYEGSASLLRDAPAAPEPAASPALSPAARPEAGAPALPAPASA
jgi:hypothetical protein